MNSILVNEIDKYLGRKLRKLINVYNSNFNIPVTIINGNKSGENILITSGIHACEYVGIKAAMELANEINPNIVSGNIIIAHPINISGFNSRVSELVPEDGKNLNRVFPGDKNGTLSERIAYTITNEFQSIADYHIDLHCGDLHEALTPYVYYAGIGNEEVVAKSKYMADLLDVKYKVKSAARTGAYNYSAIKGIPSILIERGGMGLCKKEDVDLYKKDILEILKGLNVIEGNNQIKKDYPKEINNVYYDYATHKGCWISKVKEGQVIKKGQLLGEITDYFGDVINQYYAKFDGVVLYYTVSLAIDKNNPVIAYGEI